MPATRKKSQGFSFTTTIVVIALIMLVAGTFYYITKINTTTDAPTFTIQTDSKDSPSDIESPEPIEPPISAAKASTPATELPLLDQSDPIALTAAEQLSTPPQSGFLFVKQEMIRNFVVFIDNFSRGQVVNYFSPFVRPTAPFSVTKLGSSLYLNTDSYHRYDSYAEFIQSIDIDAAIKEYQALQPLVEQAYHEIARPEDNFIDRIDQAIDVIIDTPVIDYPIELIAPSVMYKFADADLEALSDAQKLLIRMGPSNTLQIKQKLRELQRALMNLKDSLNR